MRYRFVLTVALFFVLGALVYSSNLCGPFILDGRPQIEFNEQLNALGWSFESIFSYFHYALFQTTRPVAYLSFGFNQLLGGQNLLAYHLVNIFIHALTGFGVFMLIKQTLWLNNREEQGERPFLIALFAALIWLVHPLNSQAVNYLVQRMTLLAVLFFVWGVVSFIKGRALIQADQKITKQSLLYFCLVFLYFILGMGSKSIVISLPAVLILYELLFFQKLTLKKILLIGLVGTGLLLLALGLFAIWRGNPFAMLSPNYNFSEGDLSRKVHFLTEFRVLVYYLRQFFLPDISLLRLEYTFPLSKGLFEPLPTLWAVIGLGALLISAFLGFFKNRIYSLTIFWFLGTIALESFVIKLDLVYEHRMYLSSILLVLPLVFFISKKVKLRIFVSIFSILTLTLSVMTFQRNKVWISRLSLWTQNLELSPNHERLNLNYFFAKVVYWQGETNFFEEEELNRYQNILVERLKNKPHDAMYLERLAMIYAFKKDLPKMTSYFKSAIAASTDVKVVEIYKNFTNCYFFLLKPKLALGVLLEMKEKRLLDKTMELQLIRAYFLSKDYKQALACGKQYIAKYGDNAVIYYFMSRSYMHEKEVKKGVDAILKAYLLDPENEAIRKDYLAILKFMKIDPVTGERLSD